jgi:ABC-type sugar transport system ATPase subunit
MSVMTGPLLSLENVTKRFGAVEVLHGISLEVRVGEAVAIVGDNGAGKSTLMKTITGVYKPNSGRVVFDGTDVTEMSTGNSRELGIEMIYQDLALAKMQDVASNIFLGREPTRRLFGIIPLIDRARIERESEEMIRRLGAGVPSVRQQVGLMSGGQQQSVAIARALTFDPKLVIMDEPTAALAVKEIEHVLELIRTLSARGIAVILISHRLTDVFAVCNRIIALRQGTVIADERTSETSMNAVVSHIVGAS